MLKRCCIILASLLITPFYSISQNNTFGWNDTKFQVGTKRRLLIEYELDKGKIRRDSSIYLRLDTLVRFLRNNPSLKIEIDNYSLYYPEQSAHYGQARAVAVMDTLIKLGIDSARLMARGWGVSPYPVVSRNAIALMKTSAQKDSARNLNMKATTESRRTEITILSTNYGHETFNWNDTRFYAGSKRKVNIMFGWMEGDPDNFLNLHYEYGDNKYVFDTIMDFLHKNPTVKVEIGCHSDPQGSAKHNLVLSQGKAQTIVNFLITKGMDSAQLAAKGYGATEAIYKADYIATLKTPAEKEAAYKVDRRIEIMIIDK